ncbi:uncharacterized protein LOC115683734 [Syzygium oleosum]|uniref:uncharacterized protein LOC115683734 n=1 Tax=Syzygium oleosum TaxID=219896 RepID=UPI0011D288F0|nr:uncharacterized protein LOC115683734 [Syzygium oleosum]XP_056176217.1 uncharacterized protein LOC115683734 [Syzygium oleosum]
MEARASEQQTRKESENSLQTKFTEEEEGEKSPAPALSVLQRLDHLDHLLLVLEERQSLSARYPLVAEKIRAKEQDHCKTISSAPEEAHHRGTLMDRVAMLEDRVLQLSLEIEVGIISKSSYSAVPTTGNVNQHTSELAVTATESADSREHGRENPHPLSTQEKGCADEEACAEKTKTAGSHKGKRRSMLRRSKWLCVVV